VPRRVSLPAADDLFRRTTGSDQDPARVRAVPDQPHRHAREEHGPEADTGTEDDPGSGRTPRKPSGRVRHDEKMTVYVTSDELLDLEHARLSLRRSQGLAVDRGRLVREAIALVLADYEAHGDDSVLVRRLVEE
jgi:hypothetical protein